MFCASSSTGQLMIYNKLLTARKENLNSLEHTLPGMERLLQNGEELGSTPIGFDHFRPKDKKHNDTIINVIILHGRCPLMLIHQTE